MKYFISCLLYFGLSMSSELMALEFDPVTQDLIQLDQQFPPQMAEVFIPVDGLKLSGFVLTANGPGPHPSLVLAHGLPGNEKNLDLAQSLRRDGFNVLFFHYRGAWGSEGDYSFLTLHRDVQAALQFLRDQATTYRVDTRRLSVVGHSFGGYAVLRAATQEPLLQCVVALSAANPGSIAAGPRVDSRNPKNIGHYIDQQIMLRNFPGEKAIAELKQNQQVMDTRNFGPALKGKQVLLLTGEEDTVAVPQLQQANWQHYRQAGVAVDAQTLPGDHGYTTTRILMQHQVIDWMNGHCRRVIAVKVHSPRR